MIASSDSSNASFLSQLWPDVEFVAFDTETTGRYPLAAEICELAAVRWRAGEIVSRWSSLVKPSKPMTPENVAIHGISNAMVESAPTLRQKLLEFRAALDGAIGVAHHAPFDMGFLALEFERVGIGVPTEPTICSSLLSRKVVRDSVDHKLQTLIPHLGLAQGSAHRASDDAEACLGVALHCLRTIGARSALSEAFGLQGGPLHWERFSMRALERQPIAGLLIEAAVAQFTVEIIYRAGSTPGEPRRLLPEGLVRSLDGDYVVAYSETEQRSKRFILDRIVSVKRV